LSAVVPLRWPANAPLAEAQDAEAEIVDELVYRAARIGHGYLVDARIGRARVHHRACEVGVGGEPAVLAVGGDGKDIAADFRAVVRRRVVVVDLPAAAPERDLYAVVARPDADAGYLARAVDARAAEQG
jgi:hypothetical protein